MNTIISVENITKTFKRNEKQKGIKGAFKSLFKPVYKYKTAVNDLSFKINKGEIVGFIGANGAGKSTTIKMMTGILYPTSGSITVDGLIPYESRIENAKKMGVVFGQRSQLILDIAVEESFLMQKQIYNIDDDLYNKRINFFIKELELEPLLRVPIRQMSLGQRMRCELAAVFLHGPSLVYLDEPTIGLDVKIKEVIREFIKKINEQEKTTIILTTHDMQDIEALVKRVIIIDQGSKLYDGPIENLTSQFGSKKTIFIHLSDEQTINISSSIKSIISFEQKENKCYIDFSLETIKTQDLMSELLAHNDIVDFTITNQSIEAIVKIIYSNQEVINV